MIEIFNSQKNVVEIEIRNRILNSVLKLPFFDKIENICDIIFNKSKIFNSENEDYQFLANHENLMNLLKYHSYNDTDKYMNIMHKIIVNISDMDFDIFVSKIKCNIFYDLKTFNFFMSMLIKDLNGIKLDYSFINKKMLEVLCFINEELDIEEKRKIFSSNQDLRKILIKIIFVLFNTSKNYIFNNKSILYKEIEQNLKLIKKNDRSFELF